MRKVWKAVVYAAAVCGWWGVLYPDLCLTPDTYKVVYELGIREEVYGGLLTPELLEALEAGEEPDSAKQYYDILGAAPEQIEIKSKIFTEIQAVLNKNNKDKDK